MYSDIMYDIGGLIHVYFKKMGVVKYNKDELTTSIELIGEFEVIFLNNVFSYPWFQFFG